MEHNENQGKKEQQREKIRKKHVYKSGVVRKRREKYEGQSVRRNAMRMLTGSQKK